VTEHSDNPARGTSRPSDSDNRDALLPATGALSPGESLGDLVLERRLGEGGAGEVWLARNRYTSQVFALKICRDPEMRLLLLNEARTLGQLMSAARLSHFPTSIVRLLETHLGTNPPYLVMEYVSGGDVRGLLKRRGRLEEQEVVDILLQVLDALEFIHELGLTHRDIKPENILLDAEGRARVTDFGLGRVVTENLLSVQRSIATRAKSQNDISGTLDYMAPEQLEGRPATPATDLYALGVVMFELLTGGRPRGLTSPSRRRPELRAAWDELFRRTYAHDPEDRFATPKEFRAALVGRLGDLVPELPPSARQPATDSRGAGPRMVASSTTDAPDGAAAFDFQREANRPQFPSRWRRRTDDEPRLADESATLSAAEKLRRYRGYSIFGFFLPATIWTYLFGLVVVQKMSGVEVLTHADATIEVQRHLGISLLDIVNISAVIWVYCWLLYALFARWTLLSKAKRGVVASLSGLGTFLAVLALAWLAPMVGIFNVSLAIGLHALFLGDVRAKLAGRRGLLWRGRPAEAQRAA
jgi:serine/threonine-protein kinase